MLRLVYEKTVKITREWEKNAICGGTLVGFRALLYHGKKDLQKYGMERRNSMEAIGKKSECREEEKRVESVRDSFMCTYTGHQADPLHLREEDIRTDDIAHALSLLCRGGGHMKRMYSVGQHCINCAGEAKARGWENRVVLACLLHDASEAYISDIIRPVKRHLRNYIEIEETILASVYRRYGLGELKPEEEQRVRQIDNDLLGVEMTALMNLPYQLPLAELKSEPDLSLKDPEDVETEYGRLLEELVLSLQPSAFRV